MDIRDVTRAFTHKLGAKRDKSGHHIYFYFSYEGSDYTVGKLSHAWRGHLNDTQIGMLARHLHLQNSEFEQFVECTIGADDMIEMWLQRRPRRQGG